MEGLAPSLSSLLFGLTDRKFHLEESYPSFLNNNNEVRNIIINLFTKIKFATKIHDISEALVTCIQTDKIKIKINILTPLCPDYANIDIGKGFYKLTFDGLGKGIGITAKKLLHNLNDLHSFFENYNININHIAAFGDFESLSEDTCKRVKLTQDEFIKALLISKQTLKKDSNNKLDTKLFTDLCGGFDHWEIIHSRFLNMLKNNDFGNSKLTTQKLEIICESRKPLLHRWFGKISNDQILEVVKWQGAEYATMGYIAEKNLDNPIIIGADHEKMSPFYSIGSQIPVLYLTSNYMKD